MDTLTYSALAGCVVVLNFVGHFTQKDHAARVSRQLLWGEQRVNQGRRAESTEFE